MEILATEFSENYIWELCFASLKLSVIGTNTNQNKLRAHL